MGGLAGHLKHPHEDLDLTFGDLRNLFTSTMRGELKMKEKLDGYNIHILRVGKELRFARNKKDLEIGGFTLGDMDGRFSSEGIRNVYKEAYKYILRNFPISEMEDYQLTGITYNCEILKGKLNRITYPGSMKVYIHNRWTWKDGYIKIDPVINDDLQEFVTGDVGMTPSWEEIEIPYIKDLEELCRGDWNLSLRAFYRRRFIQIMEDEGINTNPINMRVLLSALFVRFFKDGESMDLREMRKLYDGELEDFLNRKTELIRRVLAPLDEWTLRAGTTILRNVRGCINQDLLEWSCGSIKNTYEDIMDIGSRTFNEGDLSRFFTRWNCCDRQVFPYEGIVVWFRGESYKWTSSFAPINQL